MAPWTMDEKLVDLMDFVERDLKHNEILEADDMSDDAKVQSMRLCSILVSQYMSRNSHECI